MLSQYDPVKVDFILCEERALPPFPPATDRSAWSAIKEALGGEQVGAMVAAAEVTAREPVPPLPATLFLEFFRSGSRQEYETPWFRRRAALADLALAECLEDQGRFLDPLLDVAWAICEESSWELPAHHPDLPDVTYPEVGLFAALTGTQLAELVLLLGARLHPQVEARIRHEVDRRILTPFLTRHDFWWLHHTPGHATCNWTAVCSGNIIATAIYLERDRSRLAEVIARGARSLDDYLDTFDAEGGSTEGPAYWGFGFGNFALAGHLVHQRTNGRVDFFADERALQILEPRPGRRLRRQAQKPARLPVRRHDSQVRTVDDDAGKHDAARVIADRIAHEIDRHDERAHTGCRAQKTQTHGTRIEDVAGEDRQQRHNAAQKDGEQVERDRTQHHGVGADIAYACEHRLGRARLV